MVDPTGLKPAPRGLKGRRSVTRAPGQHLECAGFDGALDLGRGRLILDYRSKAASPLRSAAALQIDLAVAEGFEPSIAGLTIRCLTNLATPQHGSLDFGLGSLIELPRRRSNAQGFPGNKDQSPKIVFLEATKGVEPLSFGLQDRRSVHPIELHRRNTPRVWGRESGVYSTS